MIGFKLHAVGVGAVLLCRYRGGYPAQPHLLLRIVSIVRYHHRHTYLACHLNQHRRNLLLVGDTMLLQLDKVIVDAEYAAIPPDMRFGLGLLPCNSSDGNSPQDRLKADKPLRILCQQLLINARFIVHTLGVAFGTQHHQIPVAGFGFGKQDKVKVFADTGIGILRLCEPAAVRNIYFAADNRLYPLRLTFTEKRKAANILPWSVSARAVCPRFLAVVTSCFMEEAPSNSE